MDAQRNTLTGQMPFPDSMVVAQVCCTAKPARPVQLWQGAASEWAPFLATLPRATLTPILWPDEERQQLLRGSPVLQVRLFVWCTALPCWSALHSAVSCSRSAQNLGRQIFRNPPKQNCLPSLSPVAPQEARTREDALRQEWQQIAKAMAAAGSSAAYPAAVFNEQAFLEVG